MRFLILSLALSISSSVFARQYIQCSALDNSSSDVMVVNLTDLKKGTLFLSSGMQNPEDERILVEIELDSTDKSFYTYKVTTESIEGQVVIPSEVIGKLSNDFVINLTFLGYRLDYGCFSRIYND